MEYERQYGFVPESYLIPAGEADLTGETNYIWRNLARGESVTLTNVADPSDSVTLSSRERLCVMTAPDENGMVTVSYAADGKEYRGYYTDTFTKAEAPKSGPPKFKSFGGGKRR